MARRPNNPRPPPEDNSDDEVFGPNGPYKNPVDRFAHLSPATRAFLEELDKDDLKALDDIASLLRDPDNRQAMVALLRSFRNAGIIGKFFRWILATAIAVFLTTALIGERVRDLYSWFFSR